MIIRLADWIALAGCVGGIGGLVGLGNVLRRWGWASDSTRRLVHAGVGMTVATTPLFFSSPVPVYLLAVTFVLVNAGARGRRWWPGVHAARPESWGTVLMPLVLIPALAATWTVGPDRVYILQIAFLVLALADPLASWAGSAWGRRVWVGPSTLVGSSVFFVGALVLTGAGLVGLGDWDLGRAVTGALFVAVAATASEAIGRRGWDNVSIVFAVLLVLTPLHGRPGAASQIGGALVVGGLFGCAAHATRTLTAAGAVGGGLFAAALMALGGWAWALPGFVFFVLSSALSLLDGERSHADPSGTRSGGRRLRQVLANGAVAGLLLFVYAVLPASEGVWGPACYAGFLGALAAAAADTWATEIGGVSPSRPWSLRRGERVETGSSGAVSLVGTVGAVFGAASVTGAAALGDGGLGLSLHHHVLVVGAGLVGMTVDSLAGAFVQVQYRDPATGRVVERRPAPDATPIRGWEEVDNELVNAAGTSAGALVAILFW